MDVLNSILLGLSEALELRRPRQGKAYLTYITDTNISAAIQMCALNDSLEERVSGDDDIYLVRETHA
jgi:hypothetical protein